MGVGARAASTLAQLVWFGSPQRERRRRSLAAGAAGRVGCKWRAKYCRDPPLPLHCPMRLPLHCPMRRWVGFLFALGSLLFLITGIARLTKPVGAPEVWPPGVTSLAAGLSAWPEVIACYVVFFPACLIQVRWLAWACGWLAWACGA